MSQLPCQLSPQPCVCVHSHRDVSLSLSLRYRSTELPAAEDDCVRQWWHRVKLDEAALEQAEFSDMASTATPEDVLGYILRGAMLSSEGRHPDSVKIVFNALYHAWQNMAAVPVSERSQVVTFFGLMTDECLSLFVVTLDPADDLCIALSASTLLDHPAAASASAPPVDLSVLPRLQISAVGKWRLWGQRDGTVPAMQQVDLWGYRRAWRI